MPARSSSSAAPGPPPEIDELDVALLDALHVSPRAGFERLGVTLGVSPVTVARRWQRLSGTRRAWVSSVVGPSLALCAAMYEVECVPGRTESVGEALGRLPQVASVYLTAGTFDIVALVVAGDMAALSGLLLRRLDAVDGVARARSSVMTRWYSDLHWQLGALSAGQQRALADGGDATGPAPSRTLRFDDGDRALYLALQPDGRARYRDLAVALGWSEQLVRRRLTRLTRAGALAFRTDFTRTHGGWPTQLVLWLRVPDDRLGDAGERIAHWRETRICLSVLGPANLFVKLQLHRLDDVPELFERLRAAVPEAVVADRRMVLRPLKSWGHLLDDHGRSLSLVPVDPWAAPVD